MDVRWLGAAPLMDKGLTEIDHAAHDDDKGKIILDRCFQQFAVAPGARNRCCGDGDALWRNHFAGTGADRIGGCDPADVCGNGSGGSCLQFAEKDAARGCRTRDEGTDRADEGGDGRVENTCGVDGCFGNFMRHAAVAHDLRGGDNADDRNDRIAQADNGLAQDEQHFPKGCGLYPSTDEGCEQDEDSGGGKPGEGIRAGTRTAVDQHRGFDEVQWLVDGRNELRSSEQKDEDQDEGQAGQQAFAERNGGFLYIHAVGRILDV